MINIVDQTAHSSDCPEAVSVKTLRRPKAFHQQVASPWFQDNGALFLKKPSWPRSADKPLVTSGSPFRDPNRIVLCIEPGDPLTSRRPFVSWFVVSIEFIDLNCISNLARFIQIDTDASRRWQRMKIQNQKMIWHSGASMRRSLSRPNRIIMTV